MTNSHDGQEYENNTQADKYQKFPLKLWKHTHLYSISVWSLSYLCCSCSKLLFHRGSIQPLKSLNLLENKSVVIHIDQFHTLIKEYGNQLISCIVEWFPLVTSIAHFWIDAIFSFSCNTMREWVFIAGSVALFTEPPLSVKHFLLLQDSGAACFTYVSKNLYNL